MTLKYRFFGKPSTIDEVLQEARKRNEDTILFRLYTDRMPLYPLKREKIDTAILEIETDTLKHSSIFSTNRSNISNFLEEAGKKLFAYFKNRGFRVIQDLKRVDIEKYPSLVKEDRELILSLVEDTPYRF